MATSYSTANTRRRFAAAIPKLFAVSADYQPGQIEKGTRLGTLFYLVRMTGLEPAQSSH